MFYMMQFLDVSVKVGKSRCGQGGDWHEVEERDGVESEVYDSVTHKVQFNVNCQMISLGRLFNKVS